MGKILYPVGTRVVVKSIDAHSPLYVVDYRKGEKYPYRLGDTPAGQPVEVAGKSKFSIKGLKRYTPNSPKKTTDEPQKPVEGTATHSDMVQKQKAVCQCDMSEYYTKEEVKELLDLALDDVYRNLDINVGSLRSDLLAVARVTDRNFCTVKKQFKASEHNDD